jgi:hypothetical protein
VFLSLDDLPEKEETQKVNSPRSVEVCMLEGILLSELLYKPLEFY